MIGLDTWLYLGRLRPVISDEEAGRVPGIVHVHLGHLLMRKSVRILRANLLSPHSEVSRVAAVVLPGLDHPCAASMPCLVLMGCGGLRPYEQVLVTGMRLRGHHIAEDTLHGVLDRSLDPDSYRLAGLEVRHHLAALWNDGDHLRTRLVEEMARRAQSLQAGVHQSLDERRQMGLDRVCGTFAASRANLIDSPAHPRAQEREQQAMLDLWSDEQRQQRAWDI